jgi:hypothetical protein
MGWFDGRAFGQPAFFLARGTLDDLSPVIGAIINYRAAMTASAFEFSDVFHLESAVCF